jgi:hypothetical protein
MEFFFFFFFPSYFDPCQFFSYSIHTFFSHFFFQFPKKLNTFFIAFSLHFISQVYIFQLVHTLCKNYIMSPGPHVFSTSAYWKKWQTLGASSCAMGIPGRGAHAQAPRLPQPTWAGRRGGCLGAGTSVSSRR